MYDRIQICFKDPAASFFCVDGYNLMIKVVDFFTISVLSTLMMETKGSCET